MDLRLEDGTVIANVTRPRQGTRHRVLFGIDEASGREVAVKVEILAGALKVERLALEWLSLQGGPAPGLRTASSLVSADGEAACLVCDRAPGDHPTSSAGWARLGRALARLSQLSWKGSGLGVQDHDAFLAGHDARVADLDAAVGDGAAAIAWPSVPDRFRESPLVLTHGDPGPATSSTTKSLARSSTGRTRTSRLAASIWPGPSSSPWSGPDRYVAEEHASRARAVVAGFSGEGGAWAPDEEELTWWLAVAGAQFAHRRLQRAGEPGVLPWAEALTVLDDVLRNDSTAALLATA